METVKTNKVDGKIVVSGTDRLAVQNAGSALERRGIVRLSKVENIGQLWVITFKDPEDRRDECQVLKVGLQLMIKGPTREIVEAKVEELVGVGAKLVSPPSETNAGGWVAICDDVAQTRKW